jgi:hypothetical protein
MNRFATLLRSGSPKVRKPPMFTFMIQGKAKQFVTLWREIRICIKTERKLSFNSYQLIKSFVPIYFDIQYIKCSKHNICYARSVDK